MIKQVMLQDLWKWKSYPDGHDSTPVGYENVKLGDLVIYRDNLMMTHAGV